jgi:hypothetical protein
LYNSAHYVRVVEFYELRKEGFTDKEEYQIGEPVKVTLIIYNDYNYPVKYKVITQYSISG